MDAMGFQEPPQRHPYLTTLSVGVSQWGGVRFMKGTPAMPQLLGLKMSKSKIGKKSLETGEIEVYIKSSLDFDSYFDFLILSHFLILTCSFP